MMVLGDLRTRVGSEISMRFIPRTVWDLGHLWMVSMCSLASICCSHRACVVLRRCRKIFRTCAGQYSGPFES